MPEMTALHIFRNDFRHPPPTTMYSRTSRLNLLLRTSGTISRRSKYPRKRSISSSAMPLAHRNSSNDREYIVICRSYPTGMDFGSIRSRRLRYLYLIPSSEPDATTSHRPSSARNLNAVRAFGQSCNSSRNNNVRPGTISKSRRNAEMPEKTVSASRFPLKAEIRFGSFEKLISMNFS